MKNYEHKDIKQDIEIGVLANTLIDEIESTYRPLFDYMDKQSYAIKPDPFNPIRLLMPLLEVASELEFKRDPRLLLEELSVPKPDIIWPMFRHGLSHFIRPFYIMVDNKRINWAIPQLPSKHYDIGSAIGISAPKLLEDLQNYLKKFIGNTNVISIQTGLELTLE